MHHVLKSGSNLEHLFQWVLVSGCWWMVLVGSGEFVGVIVTKRSD